MSRPVPTRWMAQLEGQLADAERRLSAADRHIAAGSGGRALEEVYPGVMAAATVKVWMAVEPWHAQRSYEEYQRLVREELPSGFAAIFGLESKMRTFEGWRTEDARPLIEEARAFVASVRNDLGRWFTGTPPSA